MSEGARSRLVITAPQTTAEKLQTILAGAALEPDAVYGAGGDALASVREEGALVLTTWQLPDMSGEDFAGKLSDAYDVLMIVPGDYREPLDEAAFTLRNPISQDALIQSVRAVSHCRARMQKLRGRVRKLEQTLENRKAIDRAKGRLMDELHLTEAQAHHLIQKQSMDTGRRISDVAAEVLETKDLSELNWSA